MDDGLLAADEVRDPPETDSLRIFFSWIDREWDFAKSSLNYHRTLSAGILASISTISWAILAQFPDSPPRLSWVLRTLADAGPPVVIVSLFYAVVILIIAHYDWKYRRQQAEDSVASQREEPLERVIGATIYSLGGIGSVLSFCMAELSPELRLLFGCLNIIVFAALAYVILGKESAFEKGKRIVAWLGSRNPEGKAKPPPKMEEQWKLSEDSLPLLGAACLMILAFGDFLLLYTQVGIDQDLFQLAILLTLLITFSGAALRTLRGVRRDGTLLEWLNKQGRELSCEIIKEVPRSAEALQKLMTQYSDLLAGKKPPKNR